MSVLHEIEARRSIRSYQSRSLPRPVLEEILEAARLAPSSQNRQPWKFVVFGGEQKARFLDAMAVGLERESRGDSLRPLSAGRIAGAQRTLEIMRQASVVVAVVNPEGGEPFDAVGGEAHVAELLDTVSVGAAVENMLLQAQALGVGSLWIGFTFFAYPELTAALGWPGQLLSAVALGYADEAPAPRPRKALEEIVEYRL